MHEQLLSFQQVGDTLIAASIPTAALPNPVHLPHFLRIVNVDIIGPGPLPKVI